MPACLSRPSRWRSLFALVLLASIVGARTDRASAYGCGPSPEVGDPQDVPRERWRYTREGAGSFTIVNADGNGVVALMNTPGCATSVIGLASLDPVTGTERWWRKNEGAQYDIGGAVQIGDAIVLETMAGLVAIDAATGKERWRLALSGYYPTVATATEETVIAEAEDELVAVDLETGDTLWETPIGGPVRDWITAYDDGTVIGAFSDTADGGPVTVVAYETSAGTELWHTTVEPPEGTQPLTDLIAGAEGMVLVHLLNFGEPSALVALGASAGEERWRFDDLGEGQFGSRTTVVGTEDPVAVVPSSDADGRPEVIALDAIRGEERWRSTAIQGLLVADESAVVGPISDPDGSGGLGGLDPATGDLLWSLPITGAEDPEALIGASSILADGRAVIALAPSQDAETARAVAVAIDPAHGDLVWQASYPEFEALFVEAAGAGAVFLTAGKGSEATLLALDTD